MSPIKTPSEIDVKSKQGVKASESRTVITMRLHSDQVELHRVICNVECAMAKSLIALLNRAKGKVDLNRVEIDDRRLRARSASGR